ncbi:MAG: hypothetical protein EXR49_02625 [Dehalococcoidia bacterium]|nr:hypothetical protein [Dehalococcoidia bacterium]
MPVTHGINLAFIKASSPGAATAWGEWFDTVHMPDLLDSGVFWNCSRWEVVVENPAALPRLGFTHINMGRYGAPDIEGALAKMRAKSAGWRDAGRNNANHVVDEFIPMKPCPVSPPMFAPSPNTTGLLFVFNRCTDASKMEAWHQWLDTVHLPACMEAGQFAGYSRWTRQFPTQYGPNYAVVWEIREQDILAPHRRLARYTAGATGDHIAPPYHAGSLMFVARPRGKWGAAGLTADAAQV